MSASTKTTKNTDSLIIIIRDRSGSMSSCKKAMDDGLRDFLKAQRETTRLLRETCNVSLYDFDDQYEVVFENTSIVNVHGSDLIPRGSTALLDAIGRTITRVKEQLHGLAHKPRVLVLIITDGHENSSSLFTTVTVRKLIEARTKKGWDFSYLGANQDAILTAREMGIPVASSMTFDTHNTEEVYAAASAGFTRTRSGLDKSVSYTAAERDQSVGKEQ